jgi:flagellar biosynthesis protein FlhB
MQVKHDQMICWTRTANAEAFLHSYHIDLQLFANPEDEGRTEEPTEYKKRKSREEGKVAKSQELNSSLILVFVFWTIAVASGFMLTSMMEMMRYYFTNMGEIRIDELAIYHHFIYFIWLVVKPCIPVFVVGMVIGFVSNIVQVGVLFTSKPLTPDFKRIMPKFSKVFVSKQTLFNLLKSILKVAIVLGISVVILGGNMNTILTTTEMGISNGMQAIVGLAFQLVTAIGIAMVALSIPDLLFQRREHHDSLKMNRKELKEEQKDYEGDPLIKQALRERQREIMSRRMLEEVPKATVVITNPTHFAIALRYENASMLAPMVVAKGQDHMAKRIISIAQEHKIHVYENKFLARILYKEVEIGELIPEKFYTAVADVLAFVYHAKGITMNPAPQSS